LKVSAGKPRPTAAISARLATLVYRVVNFIPLVHWLDVTHAFFIDVPHWFITGSHRSLILGAAGVMLDTFSPGNSVSYGGGSVILQKNLHFGSGS
jgi:hypothetical protein